MSLLFGSKDRTPEPAPVQACELGDEAFYVTESRDVERFAGHGVALYAGRPAEKLVAAGVCTVVLDFGDGPSQPAVQEGPGDVRPAVWLGGRVLVHTAETCATGRARAGA